MTYSINPGDLIQTSKLNVKMFAQGEPKPRLVADFSAGRGQSFVCLFLGSTTDGTELDPDKIMNAMGWVYDPERAHAEVK